MRIGRPEGGVVTHWMSLGDGKIPNYFMTKWLPVYQEVKIFY